MYGPGEVVALLGENGAGKSTVSNIIAGSAEARCRQITWQGKPYAPASPAEAIDAGIGMIHQELKLLPDLSVAENVYVGRLLTRGGLIDRAAMNERAAAQLKRLGLNVSPDRKVRTLRVAARQQVEIAKALALDAQLLIFDEPTAALGGEETELLFRQIRQLKAKAWRSSISATGWRRSPQIADRIVVMRDGRIVARHDSADVPVRTVVEQMVGRSLERMFPELAPPQSEVLLEVEGLTSAAGAFRDVGFSVRAGEILGIAGLIGAGRTELVRAIAGADPVASGSVAVAGRAITSPGRPPLSRRAWCWCPRTARLRASSSNRRSRKTLRFGNFDHVAPKGWVWPKAWSASPKRHPAARRQGPPGSSRSASSPAAISRRWSSPSGSRARRKVFILDEPTRGIDVGARAAIYDVIADLARSGMAVVVVSSDLEEVLGLSHRVLVLARGRQRGILARGEANDVAVMELATS